MFIRKKYKNRHRILQTLQEHFELNHRLDSIDLSEIQLSFPNLATKSKLSEDEIKKQIDYLNKEDEIKIDDINFSSYYRITTKGGISFYDGKYLNIGRRAFLADALKLITILSTLILLLFAIIKFVNNMIETPK